VLVGTLLPLLTGGLTGVGGGSGLEAGSENTGD
jgi:hypothetical protein